MPQVFLTAKHAKSTSAKASVDKNVKCTMKKQCNSVLCDLCVNATPAIWPLR